MHFDRVPLADASGKILAHNMAGSDGKRLLQKGRSLTHEDIQILAENGTTHVYAVWLDPDDVGENEAAQTIAEAIRGDNLELSRASVGRVNLRATSTGVLQVDIAQLQAINQTEEITVATLSNHAVVTARKIVATVKIIPFAIRKAELQRSVNQGVEHMPILRVDVLPPARVGLILYGSSAIQERLSRDFSALEDRIVALGSTVTETAFVDLTEPEIEDDLARVMAQQRQTGVSLIMVAGETAIMHRNDMIPRAVVKAGGRIECVGAPVEPGNLLMLAYLDGIPIMGAPGCARSRKPNVVDQIIPRLLVGEHLNHEAIIALAHGGLLNG